MKIGIYGGSFNPIHFGHIKIATYVLENLKLDKILIIPVGTPSHRENNLVSGEYRLKMCQLAFEKYKNIEISDIEIKNTSISYTIDTLKKIQKLYGEENEFFEIIGEDSADYFSQWKDYKKILEKSKVVVLKRKGYKSLLQDKNLIYLNSPLFNVSSTLVRGKLKNEEDTSEFLPKKVLEFIKENKLYI